MNVTLRIGHASCARASAGTNASAIESVRLAIGFIDLLLDFEDSKADSVPFLYRPALTHCLMSGAAVAAVNSGSSRPHSKRDFCRGWRVSPGLTAALGHKESYEFASTRDRCTLDCGRSAEVGTRRRALAAVPIIAA